MIEVQTLFNDGRGDRAYASIDPASIIAVEPMNDPSGYNRYASHSRIHLSTGTVIESSWPVDVIRNKMRQANDEGIAAERERCAKIAESFIPSGFRNENGKVRENAIAIARDDRARTIAHAIRNQKDA